MSFGILIFKKSEHYIVFLLPGLDTTKTRGRSASQLQSQKELTNEQAALDAELVVAQEQEQRMEKIVKDSLDVKEIVTNLHDMVNVCICHDYNVFITGCTYVFVMISMCFFNRLRICICLSYTVFLTRHIYICVCDLAKRR